MISDCEASGETHLLNDYKNIYIALIPSAAFSSEKDGDNISLSYIKTKSDYTKKVSVQMSDDNSKILEFNEQGIPKVLTSTKKSLPNQRPGSLVSAFIFYPLNASDPLVTSRIAPVMAAWRALLKVSVNSLIKSVALSVALCIAVIRAPCSAAFESSKAL